MREREVWAESDGHLKSNAARPAAPPITNSRRPGICVPGSTVQDFEGLQNRAEIKKKSLQGRRQTTQFRIVLLPICLYDVQERAPMGHVDYFRMATHSSFFLPYLARPASAGTFGLLFTPRTFLM